MRVLIVVPARYASTRFPGKPLHRIAGRPLLDWVVDVARQAVTLLKEHGMAADYCVATEDSRIADYASSQQYPVVLTPASCPTGSDRAYEAATAYDSDSPPDYVVNMQGDAPLTDPQWIVASVLRLVGSQQCHHAASSVVMTSDTHSTSCHDQTPCDITTPVIPLSWEALDALREAKLHAPFSGTTVICDAQQRARWFSKQILPAIRNEDDLRATQPYAPVLVHIGLYAYSMASLTRYVALPITDYERYEGLEQLRALEHGLHIGCVFVKPPYEPWLPRGVDTPYDASMVASRLLSTASPLNP